MKNIYGEPGTSIETLNAEKEITLRFLQNQERQILHEIIEGEKGIRGEKIIGEKLNTLANEGYVIIHDIPFQIPNSTHTQNIDHILIYENRIVIIVESKAYSEYSYNHYKDNVIQQVRNQYNYLNEFLGTKYIKGFVCLSRLTDIYDDKNSDVTFVDKDSLISDIKLHVEAQKKYHPNHIGAKEKILALKGWH